MNKLGIHALVWVGGWSQNESRQAIAGAAGNFMSAALPWARAYSKCRQNGSRATRRKTPVAYAPGSLSTSTIERYSTAALPTVRRVSAAP